MWICEGCGAWLEAQALDPTPTGMTILCPECGHRESFVQNPLWWITGSSASGKSSIIPHLRRAMLNWFIFDGEAIDFWRFSEGDSYTALYEQWLKVGHQVALNGQPLVIVATALPAQIDACACRAYFSTIHFLGLVCPEAEQRQRLHARPAWRQSHSEKFISGACGFTRTLETLAREDSVRLTIHDTSATTPVVSAAIIARWAGQQLAEA